MLWANHPHPYTICKQDDTDTMRALGGSSACRIRFAQCGGLLSKDQLKRPEKTVKLNRKTNLVFSFQIYFIVIKVMFGVLVSLWTRLNKGIQWSFQNSIMVWFREKKSWALQSIAKLSPPPLYHNDKNGVVGKIRGGSLAFLKLRF